MGNQNEMPQISKKEIYTGEINIGSFGFKGNQNEMPPIMKKEIYTGEIKFGGFGVKGNH